MKGESVCSVLLLLAGLQVVRGELVQQLFSYHSDQSIFSNLTAPYLSFLDYLYYHLGAENVSEQCKSDTNQLIRLARQGNTDALKILDSNGKPSSGILEGGVYFIGFYSECVNTAFKAVENTVHGKYCLINLQFSTGHQEVIPQASWLVLTQNSKPPTIAVCVPLSCSENDVQFASNASAHENFEDNGATVSVCHGDVEGFSKDVGAIITLIVFLIFGVIAVAATVSDIVIQKRKQQRAITETTAMKENNKTISTQELYVKEMNESERTPSLGMQCLLAFSFKTNADKIFSVKQGGDNIGSVHGLKFLTMSLIIMGHTYSFATQNLFIRNPLSAQAAPKNFVSQVFANGTLAVDTFYLISGVLVTFVTLKQMKKIGGKLPLLYFYIHRYFRLTPLLGAVVMFCAFLLKYMNSGPNWLSSIEMYDVWCKNNGWLNVLYLHNFINTEHMCLSHSWYLATDMQMYLVTPLILIPLYKNVKYGAISISIFLFATTLTTALITAINHYPAIPYVNNVVPLAIVNEYYKNVYIKTYCRMGPYLIGITVGYFLVEKKELIITKRTLAIIWSVSIGLGLAVIYLMWPANMGHLPSNSEAAAYSSLARTVWGICMGWLLIACFYGYGGIINSILSCSVLVPLSRLTYCAYLIHPVVMNVYYGSTQTIMDFSSSFIMYTFMGNLCITYALSIFLSLLFESPFVGLEKVLLFRKKSS